MPNTDIQLRITTDMNTLPAAIEFNYSELKAALQNHLSRFDGLVVTEADIRQATVDRAEINRIAKTISRARIDTKKRLLGPFELFEARAKELEGLCHDVEGKIAEQLDAFERDRTAKKSERLRRIWADKLAEAFGDLKSAHFVYFFDAATNPKRTGNWLNKGVSEDAAAREMDAEIQRCRDTLDTVATMYADADEEIKAKAQMEVEKTMDIQYVVQAVTAFRAERAALESARRAAEERAKAAEEARKAAEAAAVAPAPAAAPAPAPAPAPAKEEAAAPAEEPDPAQLYLVTLRLTGTAEQLRRMIDYIVSIGVSYEKVTA